jgi:hypothetical protein
MRYTRSVVQAHIDNVNRLLGFDPETVQYNTVGALRLYSAYDAWTVHRVSNDGAGVSDVMGRLTTLREVALFLQGMREALYLVRETAA